MKKFLATVGLLALFGLCITLTSMAEESAAEEQAPVVLLEGKIIATGPCAQLVLCTSPTVVNLLGLPSSYNVGDEVVLKGTLFSGPTICPAGVRTVVIGKIKLDPC